MMKLGPAGGPQAAGDLLHSAASLGQVVRQHVGAVRQYVAVALVVATSAMNPTSPSRPSTSRIVPMMPVT